MSFTKQLAFDLSCLVKGQLSRVFDKSNFLSLVPIAKAFGRIKIPARVKQIQSKLKILNHQIFMMKTGVFCRFSTVCHRRVMSLAELIRTAGFEAIQYQSSKGSGKCLAIFPDLLEGRSFVELIGTTPASVKHQRLDNDSANELAGWESIPTQRRSR